MKLFGLAVAVAALLSLAPLSASPVSACSFSGPVPTPPAAGAELGADCNWQFPDGTVLPAFDGMEEFLSQNYVQRDDGYWVPRGMAPSLVQYEAVSDEGGSADSVQQAETENGKDLPIYIILPAAFIVPLAVIFIGSFLIPPKGGGH